jgi:anti-anti-sigma factor
MNLVKVSHAQGRVPITVLHLQNRINLGNIDELEKTAREVFTGGGRDMIIDLSKAPSITSAGIRSILVIHKMLSGAGKEQINHLKLVSPTPPVQEVLKVTGLLDYLQVFASLDEAVRSF